MKSNWHSFVTSSNQGEPLAGGGSGVVFAPEPHPAVKQIEVVQQNIKSDIFLHMLLLSGGVNFMGRSKVMLDFDHGSTLGQKNLVTNKNAKTLFGHVSFFKVNDNRLLWFRIDFDR